MGEGSTYFQCVFVVRTSKSAGVECSGAVFITSLLTVHYSLSTFLNRSAVYGTGNSFKSFATMSSELSSSASASYETITR